MREYIRDGHRRIERELIRHWFAHDKDARTRDPDRVLRSLSEEPTLLFLCYGNICRSPLAGRYAERRFEEEDIDAQVIPAGFHDNENRRSPDHAQDVAETAHDVDLGNHRSQQITKAMVSASDLIFVKNARNYAPEPTF